jgi:hypothetical protein
MLARVLTCFGIGVLPVSADDAQHMACWADVQPVLVSAVLSATQRMLLLLLLLLLLLFPSMRRSTCIGFNVFVQMLPLILIIVMHQAMLLLLLPSLQ